MLFPSNFGLLVLLSQRGGGGGAYILVWVLGVGVAHRPLLSGSLILYQGVGGFAGGWVGLSGFPPDFGEKCRCPPPGRGGGGWHIALVYCSRLQLADT